MSAPPGKKQKLAIAGFVLGLVNSFMWFGKFRGWWN